ncbi:Short-chain dehydrogenase [Geosmithia morbida]|uniref:Short-chain dehydrogenase/reductase 3 n=1 Tax=Geosmithia morbida TaxID=1094350 RepID=A0A9P5CZD9_9HYPO|nr:Short-chain dehydrogenase [Geosmithia morbida]KAF4121473.1 Short-chain dehydrogenase [Geosmithia morbida]
MATSQTVMRFYHTVKSIVLNPIVPGSALVFLTYAPADVVAKLLKPEVVSRYLSGGVADLKFPLQIVLGVAIVRTVNRFLSRCALSNWTITTASGWDWPKEIAVVTGGSGGIGRDMVLNLTAKGVRVAVLDVAPLPADMEADGLIRHFQCDVSDHEAVRAAADAVRSTFGHPTILVNNAGIVTNQPILDTSPDYVQKVVGVNLLSLWYTTQQFVPNMILADKGHVVTIASAASYTILANAAHYSATKAGALAFTDTLRAELNVVHKVKGVLTTCVHPWWATSGMTSRYADAITSSMGPMLTSQFVADSVTKQIFSRRAGHVFVPDMYSWMSSIRHFPSWVQIMVNNSTAKMTPLPAKKTA